eukprot:COSAG04_NODE_51_length_31064_cov_38.384789_8_plen_90_part_00
MSWPACRARGAAVAAVAAEVLAGAHSPPATAPLTRQGRAARRGRFDEGPRHYGWEFPQDVAAPLRRGRRARSIPVQLELAGPYASRRGS